MHMIHSGVDCNRACFGFGVDCSTMSGRRLVDTVKDALRQNGVTDATVLVTSLSNGYSAYVTTEEEYSVSSSFT